MSQPSQVIHSLSSAIDAIEAIWSDTDDGRWPVYRTGERQPIPDITRWLIKSRDNYRCTLCGDDYRLVLDHIVPWSAGGPDLSSNLRTLCWGCNERRSNRREAYLPRVVPVAVICDPCLVAHDTTSSIKRWHQSVLVWPHCPMCTVGYFEQTDDQFRVWCGSCTAVSWTSIKGRLL